MKYLHIIIPSFLISLSLGVGGFLYAQTIEQQPAIELSLDDIIINDYLKMESDLNFLEPRDVNIKMDTSNVHNNLLMQQIITTK